jgi:hypothetical protein
MYRAVTRDIEVKVAPRFLPERSSIEQSYYFWSYTIEITNLGRDTVQLKTRHWRITDAFGRLQHGGVERRAFRNRHPCLFARQPAGTAHGELTSLTAGAALTRP